MTRHEQSGASRAGLALGGLVMVVCCAGPALVAAGALGVVGRLVGNPLVVLAAVAAATAAVVGVLRRPDRGGDGGCRPPGGQPQDTGASRTGRA
jgi:mercuric ion transport protein